ncbi:hypothetical protein [Formosa agariphila]|nr:hypothetical protein [Formosa agariphila]
MDYVIEIYTLVLLLSIGLLYGFYKLTIYAFWCNQLWIGIVLTLIYIIDSASIPFISALIYFGYTLILFNIMGFVFFQKKEFTRLEDHNSLNTPDYNIKPEASNTQSGFYYNTTKMH